jgi:hypothetical protein
VLLQMLLAILPTSKCSDTQYHFWNWKCFFISGSL